MHSRQIYKGSVVDLRLEEVTLPNGVTVQLEMIHHPGAAAIVALDDEECVTLIHQFRHAADGFIWEIPAGKLDAGETPSQCAVRELQEETGLAAGLLMHLGSVLTAPGFCNERIHLFLARDLHPVASQLEADEVLTVHRVPLFAALAMIRSGEMQDAKSIAGLHLAAEHLRTGT